MSVPAGTIRCDAWVSHASGSSLSARSSAAIKKAPPKRGSNCPHACRRHSPYSHNVEPGLRFDELGRILRKEARSLETVERGEGLSPAHACGSPSSDIGRSDGGRTQRSTRAPIAKPASTSVVQCARITIRVAAMTPPIAQATGADFG